MYGQRTDLCQRYRKPQPAAFPRTPQASHQPPYRVRHVPRIQGVQTIARPLVPFLVFPASGIFLWDELGLEMLEGANKLHRRIKPCVYRSRGEVPEEWEGRGHGARGEAFHSKSKISEDGSRRL